MATLENQACAPRQASLQEQLDEVRKQHDGLVEEVRSENRALKSKLAEHEAHLQSLNNFTGHGLGLKIPSPRNY